MRTVCGLLTVLLILGPIGMGMLFNVDAPLLEEGSLPVKVKDTSPEDKGTRSPPVEGSTYVNLYLHNPNTVMNTTEPWSTTVTSTTSDITFDLDFALNSKLWVKDTVGERGMQAEVYLQGVGPPLQDSSVTVTVFEDEGGTQVGQKVHELPTSYPNPQLIPITIDFEPSLNRNYNFSKDHKIVIEFSITGTVSLYYDMENRPSRLRLYCQPIADIEVKTLDFTGNPPSKNIFYPKNIDYPVNRRQVQITGKITDAWGNYDVDEVNVEIKDPDGGIIPRTANWNKDTGMYNYTWFYSETTTDPGKYQVKTQVIDKQGHNYSASSSFNMSYYGVVLTSPDQVDGEGKYLSPAKRNVIQNGTTTYKINVINVGANATSIDIATALSTPSRSWWNWKLENKNITLDPDEKSGRVLNLEPGKNKAKSIFLTMDGANKALEDYVGILVQGTCVDKTSESDTLNTRTDVVVEYDVELKFLDGTKNQTKYVEMGDTVSYDFKVTNTGGADDYIWLELGTPPSGWTITLSGNDLLKNSPIYGDYYVHLAPGESSERITLKLDTMPTGDDVTANITITGKSWGSEQQSGGQDIESDTITTTTIMTKGVKLEIISDDSQDWSPGDSRLVFNLKLTNTGTTTASFTVSFDPLSSSDGWSTGDISLDKENLQLASGNNEMISLYIEPTIEVMAGDYDITVRADRGTTPSTSYEEVTVYCTVNEYHNIEVIDPPDLELYGETEPGKDVEYEIRIKNSGNTAERVSIVLVNKPGDWELDFGNANDTWSKELDPQDIETVTVVLTPPDDAAGDETVDITISVVPVESDQIDIETHTKIKSLWFQPLIILLVPILLLIVIVVMVIVIYKRR